MNHGLDGAFERFAGRERTVSFNENSEAVEIRAVADAHVLYFVIHAANGRENRVERDGADVYPIFLMHLLSDVPQAAFGAEFDFEICLAGQISDVLFGIEYFHLSGEFEIHCRNLLRAFHGELYRLRFVRKEFQANPPYIEKNSYDVF